MKFEYLCERYQLGRFRGAVCLHSGTVSRVWKLETDDGIFAMRALKDREQGEREQSFCQQLRSNGFTQMPAILVPSFEQEGLWYQIQEYLIGTRPDPALPGMAAQMAQVVKHLSETMPTGMIHGDLGPWNLLLGEGGVLHVIDFGEVRQGDIYYDFATLFAGIINHTTPELRQQVCGAFLRELDCDRARLLEQLHTWAEQGKERWRGVDDNMAARFDHALNWAKEHLYEL